jgi:hypothetical protein
MFEDESDMDAGVEPVAADDAKAENMFDLPPFDAPQHEHEAAADSVSFRLLSRRTPIAALPFQFNRLPAPADTRSLAPALHMYAPAAYRKAAAAAVVAKAPTSPVLAPAPASSLSAFAKRKRASLPAYFSHLTLTAPASPSPPTLAQINVHVDIGADMLATPLARTEPGHSHGHQRGKSEQLREAWRDGSRASRVPVPVPVPGKEWEQEGRTRGREPEDEMTVRGDTERRGRSRIVIPRLKMDDS